MLGRDEGQVPSHRDWGVRLPPRDDVLDPDPRVVRHLVHDRRDVVRRGGMGRIVARELGNEDAILRHKTPSRWRVSSVPRGPTLRS
jgi:hypothetical protein